MGKRENIIRAKNNEYYKEQNKKNEDLEKFKIEEDKLQKQEEKILKSEELFEKTVSNVIENIKYYTDNQGLFLFDNINTENIENYVKYIIKNRNIRKPKPSAVPVQVQLDTTPTLPCKRVGESENSWTSMSLPTSFGVITTEPKPDHVTPSIHKSRIDIINSDRHEENLIKKGIKELRYQYNIFFNKKTDNIDEILIEHFGLEEYYKMVLKLGKIVESQN